MIGLLDWNLDPQTAINFPNFGSRNGPTELEKYAFALNEVTVIPKAQLVELLPAHLGRALEAGNRGVERIPGKHGTKATAYAQIVVMIDDKPGELGRLFNEVGEIGVNIEELKLEHSPSSLIGLVELFVMPNEEAKLVTELASRGWRIAG